MFYISLHAVLSLLMMQTYWMGITFIYTVHFVGADGMRVRLSAHKSGSKHPLAFVNDHSKAVLPSFPIKLVCLFLYVFCVFVTIYIHVVSLFCFVLIGRLSAVNVVFPL